MLPATCSSNAIVPVLAGKDYQSILLVQGKRVPAKRPPGRPAAGSPAPKSVVVHETLANLSKLPPDLIELIERHCKAPSSPLASPCPPARGSEAASAIHLGPCYGVLAALDGLAREMGLVQAVGEQSRSQRLARFLIYARLAHQGSRLSAARWSEDHAVREVLQVGRFDEDDLYTALEDLEARQASIEAALAAKAAASPARAIYLYDVTSVYFEGLDNELADFGYNADHPVHRRSSYPDRGRRRGGHGRRGQPAQAGAGARHATHDRGDDLGRISAIYRERPGADPALPADPHRRARRRHRRGDAARPRRSDGEAPQGARDRRSDRRRRQFLASLHPGAPTARQSGQSARHRLCAGGDQPARQAGRGRGRRGRDRGAGGREAIAGARARPRRRERRAHRRDRRRSRRTAPTPRGRRSRLGEERARWSRRSSRCARSSPPRPSRRPKQNLPPRRTAPSRRAKAKTPARRCAARSANSATSAPTSA